MPRLQRLSKLFPESKGDPKKTLLAGANVYLNFLTLTRRLTRRRPLDLILTSAASRYMAYQNFREQNLGKSIPTRDISTAWAADMLCPADYKYAALDEKSDFPYLKYHIPLSDGCSWYSHQLVRLLQTGYIKPAVPLNSASEIEFKKTADKWVTLCFKDTADKWGEMYPDHKYRYMLDELPELISADAINAPVEETQRRTEVLAKGMEAQAIFQHKMLAMGPSIINDAYLDRAVDRYAYTYTIYIYIYILTCIYESLSYSNL